MPRAWWIALLLAAGVLPGCFPRVDPAQPIPIATVPAPQQARRLVVVLPGRADDLRSLRASGIAQAVQSAWPDADVVLTGLGLGYYMKGVAERRLHEELIQPARQRGYQQVWLVGASLGGMGAIMYDRAHPGQVTGMVLLAPYLGEPTTWGRVKIAGGVARWEPPPEPDEVTAANFQQEIWRQVQRWSRDPAATRNVWMAYGRRDHFAEPNALLAPVLPPGQVLVREGGHDWDVWTPAAREVLLRIGKDARAR